MARLQRGAHFGEQALVQDQRRTADVVATTEVQVLEMSQANFQAIAADIKAALTEEHGKRLLKTHKATLNGGASKQPPRRETKAGPGREQTVAPSKPRGGLFSKLTQPASPTSKFKNLADM